jgi:photosystem II stability/assembly factor-like uncharacterized protein
LVNSQHYWQQCNGPLGGMIADQFYKDGILYSGSNNGVYISEDNGNKFKNIGLRSELISLITHDSEFIYAGNWYGALFRKNFSGDEWLRIQSPSTSRITQLRVHQSGALVATTRLNGIYISFNHGESWEGINNGLPDGQLHVLLITSSGDIISAVEFIGLFKSTDLGLTWNYSGQSLASTTIRCLLEDTTGNIYAGTAIYYPFYEGGIFRTTDQGSSWHHLGYPADNVAFIYQASNGNIYFGSDHGFYRSTDGLLWTKIGAGLFQPQYISMSESNTGDLFIGSFDGIFKSSDLGLNFKLAGLPVRAVYSLARAYNGNIWAGTNFGVWESSDMGDSWLNDRSVTQGRVFAMMKTSANSVLAGLEEPFGIFKKTWISGWYSVMTEEYTTRDIKQTSGGAIYSASATKLFRSGNDGNIWTTVNTSQIPVYHALKTFESDGGKFYLGTNGGGVYTSTDSGSTWQTCNDGLGSMTINFLLTDKNKILAASDHGVFIFSGEAWKDINSDLTRRKVNHLFAADSVFYAATDSGVYSYTYSTGEWNSLNEGLNAMYILSLGIDKEGHLLAGTLNESVYRLNVPVISDAAENEVQIPGNFVLRQNYPNPFNPSTKISFSIPEQVFVSINIYDILGRLVSEIISKEKSAGDYEFIFNGKNLPSGVYICRLSAGKFSQTIKMTMTK